MAMFEDSSQYDVWDSLHRKRLPCSHRPRA